MFGYPIELQAFLLAELVPVRVSGDWLTSGDFPRPCTSRQVERLQPRESQHPP